MACLDDDQLAALLEGTLTPLARAAVDAELATCEACRTLVCGLLTQSQPAAVHALPAMPELPVLPLVTTRYRIERLIGAGAMGVVFAGHDLDLDRPVAFKAMRHPREPSARAALLAEARALAALHHPNVVAAFGYEEVPPLAFIVMELVDGESLRTRLDRGRLDWHEATRALAAVGDGLAAMHAAGLIHRDVKPANVLFDRRGGVRLADFGLARSDGATGGAGTLPYLAPEVLAGGVATPLADQYALAITLWEAVVGLRPFAGTTVGDLRAEIAHGAPATHARLPPALARVLHRALQVDPAARWPDVATLAQQLRAIITPPRLRRPLVIGAVLGVAGIAAMAIGLGQGAAPRPTEAPVGCGDDCAALCGNGIVDDVAREQCDDGARATGDGCGATCQAELRAWSPLMLAPVARNDYQVAYDDHRARLVLFGGFAGSLRDDTWEFYDGAWHEVRGPLAPSPRGDTSLTYDPVGRRMVLFGGATAEGKQGDTWSYDGTWTKLAPPHAPDVRGQHNATFDRARGQVILFGGSTATGVRADTWAFDGVDWAPVALASAPAPRLRHAMYFDDRRGAIVLYGGQRDDGSRLCDTWALDAKGWTPIGDYPDGCPTQPSMAFDPVGGRGLLVGGARATTTTMFAFDDTWESLGAASAAPAGLAPASAMAFDRVAGAPVVVGHVASLDGTPAPTRVWRLDEAWTPMDGLSAPALGDAATAFDSRRSRTLLFGGADASDTAHADLWSLRDRWRVEATGPGPSARRGAAMAYDARRDQLVLVGGRAAACGLDETWLFDGQRWRQHVGPGPSARFGAAVAWDDVRGRTWMFGGVTCVAGPRVGDLWWFDGARWQVASTIDGPGPRSGAAMVYDQRRDRLVLFGGIDEHRYFDETWTYAVATGVWAKLVGPAPLARMSASLTYDPTTADVILFGGNSGGRMCDDTWVLDDGGWRQLATTGAPPGRWAATAVFDPVRHATLVLGGNRGYEPATILGDAWVLRWR